MPKKTPLTPRLKDALEESRLAFIEKFGREPGPDDPILFDPDADTPQPMDEDVLTKMMVNAFRQAGLPEELIYAFEKTGYIVTKENQHLIPVEGLFAHNAAVAEYRRQHKKGPKGG
ncbi:hypothetical protein BDE18_3360 [Paracoccus pantotrophus]|uniref:Uncharacterized protein n=1 Tax=Paracoccus pantotrophus TaxID=82367 RepID=A0AAE6TSK0_PARPN|nr:hypothetical protein [Paracoccus pantotrophus]QFG35292.1 hypothetical protein ESD82_03630 [Paracoccus pantotrophus]RKS44512.1 hypothetical protein BDE18_3360 [Paracoccus pantotrophus]